MLCSLVLLKWHSGPLEGPAGKLFSCNLRMSRFPEVVHRIKSWESHGKSRKRATIPNENERETSLPCNLAHSRFKQHQWMWTLSRKHQVVKSLSTTESKAKEKTKKKGGNNGFDFKDFYWALQGEIKKANVWWTTWLSTGEQRGLNPKAAVKGSVHWFLSAETFQLQFTKSDGLHYELWLSVNWIISPPWTLTHRETCSHFRAREDVEKYDALLPSCLPLSPSWESCIKAIKIHHYYCENRHSWAL